MKKAGLVGAVALAIATGGLLGGLAHGQSAKASMPPYKVMQVSVENAAQLEKLLNEQAAAGFRLHSDVEEKYFIFERQ